MKRDMPMGVAVLLASALGYLAMLAWVVMLGGHHRKFMFAMTTVVPIFILTAGPLGYMLLHRWLGLKVGRFLLLGLAFGLWFYWWRGQQWNWHPAFAHSPKTALLLIGFPVAGSLAFWGTLHTLAPDLGEE